MFSVYTCMFQTAVITEKSLSLLQDHKWHYANLLEKSTN